MKPDEKCLAERIYDAEAALSLLKEPINLVLSALDGEPELVADWFVDYYDNSIELVLEPGVTPEDIGDRFDAKAREWGFRLIHFKDFPSARSRAP